MASEANCPFDSGSLLLHVDLSRESRHAAFRRLISHLSDHLTTEDVAKFSFIQFIPKKGVTALDALDYLIRKGEFSPENLEPLVDLLKDVSRSDLVTELVDAYKESHLTRDLGDRSQSLPANSTTPKVSLKNRARTLTSGSTTNTPPDLQTSALEEPSNRVDYYLPMMESGASPQHYQMQPPLQPAENGVDTQQIEQGPSHTAVIQPAAFQPLPGAVYTTYEQQQHSDTGRPQHTQPRPVQQHSDLGRPQHTQPRPVQQHSDVGSSHYMQPWQFQRTSTPQYVPVATHSSAPHEKLTVTPQSMSASSSVLELQNYMHSSSEDVLSGDQNYNYTSYQTPPLFSQEQEEILVLNESDPTAKIRKRPINKILPRANSFPRNTMCYIQHGSQSPSGGPATPPHTGPVVYMVRGGTKALPRYRRAVTPPATFSKHISAPLFNHQPNMAVPVLERNSLPLGLSLRSVSLASEGSEVSHSTSATPILTKPPAACYVMMPLTAESRASSFHGNGQPYYPHYENILNFKASEEDEDGQPAPEQSTVFRRRTGSGKNFLALLRRRRQRTSSTSRISWPVKRDKLNEAIYRHKKEKLMKCPDELELDDGSKHSPKLTLYLHPFGYEEDVGTNLTLSVEMTASVKSNLPSSARVQIEVAVIDPVTGDDLISPVAKVKSADHRIFRFKQFLTHSALKDLECEQIEIRASARLLQQP